MNLHKQTRPAAPPDFITAWLPGQPCPASACRGVTDDDFHVWCVTNYSEDAFSCDCDNGPCKAEADRALYVIMRYPDEDLGGRDKCQHCLDGKHHWWIPA